MKTKDNKMIDRQYTYGYIDTKGQQIIQLQYSRAYPFHNGKAVVSKGQERTIFPYVLRPSDNYIMNHKELPVYALIDKQGRYILGFDWGRLTHLNDDLFKAQRKEYAGDGVITIKAQVLIPFEYTNLTFLGGNLFAADNGGGRDSEYTVIDINNDTLIRDKKYSMPGAKYKFGVLTARINNMTKSVLLDTRGNIKSKQEYDIIFEFQPTDN